MMYKQYQNASGAEDFLDRLQKNLFEDWAQASVNTAVEHWQERVEHEFLHTEEDEIVTNGVMIAVANVLEQNVEAAQLGEMTVSRNNRSTETLRATLIANIGDSKDHYTKIREEAERIILDAQDNCEGMQTLRARLKSGKIIIARMCPNPEIVETQDGLMPAHIEVLQ